jgi:hypothetical protein
MRPEPKTPKIRDRISSAHILALIAIILALGGNAIAFTLGKNSVGSKQLKKNAVTTAKVKKEAITAAKVKKGTLTGTQINASTLGTVRTALFANSAATASSLPPAEPWHEVGAPGEPQFQHGCKNLVSTEQTVRFYKDHEGVVHLEGRYSGCASTGDIAFQLPVGFRPERPDSSLQFGPATGPVVVVLSTIDQAPFLSGAVECGLSDCIINGITFRAES